MHTTEAAEQAARETLRGEWDAGGTISVHLPRDTAVQLLQDRGWQPLGGRHGGWEAPSGEQYWHTDEALQIALLAETKETR